jgi:hypothetical protein
MENCLMVRETGHLWYAFSLLLFLGIALITSSRAQVNTEAMRKVDLTPGLHLDIGGDIGYIGGNSSLFQNRSHLRLDYVQDWGQLFLVANYHLGMKDQLLFINKGFSHFRAVKPIRSAFSGELFLQQEFNEFIQLNDRMLIGSGLRIKWNESEDSGESSQKLSLVTGVGLMWEREKIDAGPEGTEGDPVHGELASLLRSTNYVVFDWAPKSTIGFDLNLRYDSEPPGEIEPLDLELRNGFSYTFR